MIPEIIGESTLDFLSDPNDAHAISRCLLRLIQDPDFRRKTGENARARYLSHFQKPRFEQQITQLLLRMLAIKEPSPEQLTCEGEKS